MKIVLKFLKRELNDFQQNQAAQDTPGRIGGTASVNDRIFSMVLQLQACQLPESQRSALRAIYDELFEKAIANLLSSDLCFSDASVQAVEHLKDSLLSALEPKI